LQRRKLDIKYGLISCDSHAQLDKDAFLKRMPSKWGDKIPQVKEMSDKKFLAVDWGNEKFERWFVNGEPYGPRGVSNCPTVMQDPKYGEAGMHRAYFPQYWHEVPDYVYDPVKRLGALDKDGVDAEVLFQNDPVQSATFFQGKDPAFELDCAKAYNDAVADWRRVSERYIPLAVAPYLGGIETTVGEVERAVKNGHKGLVMMAEPSNMGQGLKHFNDRYWDPLWASAQDMDISIQWHASAGVRLDIPTWKGFTRNESQAVGPTQSFSSIAQFIPNLIFSGVLDRYPTLKWVCAETGLGWVTYILEGCDHEWERRHLWTEGLIDRPSDLFRRQIYVDFWYEKAGVELRHKVGIKNIMWESDYPHSTSTWPESWDFVNRTLAGVPQEDRDAMCWKNAYELYYAQ
jgi:predicted TIM-barrel fold metal-dependent hydrolase